MTRVVSPFRSVFALLLLVGALKADVANQSLLNAEDALVYFRQVSLPALEKRVDETRNSEKDPNIVRSIRKFSRTIDCSLKTPERVSGRGGNHGFKWPESDYPILAGSKAEVQQSKKQTWMICYSTGEGGTLYAYVDIAGRLLLAFIIPEG